ncbi:MAG: metalloprotease, partial [Nanoarchaeota archaeon]|nr:metalloprotease [Nanoarchaeota archaeon]
MSQLIDSQWVILFYSTLFLLIYLNRNKFDRQGIAFILRTKLGLGLMDKVGSRARLIVKIFGYVALAVAYLGFLFITYLLVSLAFKVVTVPGTPGASLVLPGLEIAGLGTFPLIIGWISLLIIMVVHEFSHGVVARAYKIKIKSSGIAFIGPIPGAFVEPDEE